MTKQTLGEPPAAPEPPANPQYLIPNTEQGATMPNKWKALLTSRKIWLAAIGLAVALAAFVQGAITADQLVDAILALVGVVIATIAIEDHGLRSSGR